MPGSVLYIPKALSFPRCPFSLLARLFRVRENERTAGLAPVFRGTSDVQPPPLARGSRGSGRTGRAVDWGVEGPPFESGCGHSEEKPRGILRNQGLKRVRFGVHPDYIIPRMLPGTFLSPINARSVEAEPTDQRETG